MNHNCTKIVSYYVITQTGTDFKKKKMISSESVIRMTKRFMKYYIIYSYKTVNCTVSQT